MKKQNNIVIFRKSIANLRKRRYTRPEVSAMNQVLWSQQFDGIACSRTLDPNPVDNSPMHTHDHIEIYYFISGNCTYMIEGTAYLLKPHDILFKRPLEAHMLVINSRDVPYERVGISIPIDLFRAIDPDNTLFEAMMARPLGTGNRFTTADFGHNLCAEMMNRLANNGGEMDRIEILSILLFISSEASRVLRRKRFAARSSEVAARLIDHVNEHLFEDVSLENVSNAFFLSSSQINRLFKAHTGSSLRQYVTIKRLLTARDRIRSGVSTSEACFACGYNDYSAFYRAYTKEFGHPPQDDKKTTVD